MWFERLITRICVVLYVFFVGAYIFVPDARAYDYTIRSNFSNWTAQNGFGTCHPYTQSKPCISDGTYAGIDSGNVIFSYTTDTIGATITLESAAQNSSGTYYLSLDAMVGPYTASNQSTKYETLAITVYLKNQSGGTIATKTFSQNITNTSMDTYVLELGSFSGVYSMTTYISGKDGGYWNGNYGAVLSAGSVLLSDYDPTAATPTYSSAPTSTQLNLRTSTRSITGSGIYINQVGDNLDLDIQQYGDDNLVAGVGTTAQSMVDATISGDYNTVSVQQGSSTRSSDDNVALIGVSGNHNTLSISQGVNSLDTGGHRAITDITGSYNSVSLTQYNLGFGAGQFADIDVAGDDNTLSLTQRETDKMLFVDINGSDNSLTVNQKDSGEHFLDITLGSDQTVGITQEGTGDHSATINMSGYSAGLSLNQNSSTDQVYSLTQNCVNSSGCGTTTVTQQ
jgi:hypothetical protein